MDRTHTVLIAAMVTLVLSAVSAAASGGPSATIAGTVTLSAADGDTCPAEGARVTLACAADGATRTEISDERGAFRFLDVPVDSCSIEADVQGFVAPPVMVATSADGIVLADVHLGISPLRVGVIVGGTASIRVPKMPRRSHGSGSDRRLDERPAKECEGNCHVTSND
jgi:hypothetical protein